MKVKCKACGALDSIELVQEVYVRPFATRTGKIMPQAHTEEWGNVVRAFCYQCDESIESDEGIDISDIALPA